MPAGDLANIVAELRVQDVSRQAQTWGMEIPVVSDADFSSGSLTLLDVPLHSSSRETLRIYGATRDAGVVRIRVVDSFTTVLLNEFMVTLMPGGHLYHPAFASLSDFPRPSDGTVITPPTARVELDSLTPGLRLWAFVSVTNNETRHITTITPR